MTALLLHLHHLAKQQSASCVTTLMPQRSSDENRIRRVEAINLDRLNPAEDHRVCFQKVPEGQGGRGVAEGHEESFLLAKGGALTTHPRSLESLENHVKMFLPVVVEAGLVGFQMFPVGRDGRGVAEGHGESFLPAKQGALTSHPKSLENLENHVKISFPVVVKAGLVGSLVEGCPGGIQVGGTDAFVVGFHPTRTRRRSLSLVKIGKIHKAVNNVRGSRLASVRPVVSHVLLGHLVFFHRGNQIWLNQQESHLGLAITDPEFFLA